MVDWRRRLFHQRHDVTAPVTRARDLGFTGHAGRIAIDDDCRLDVLGAAATPRHRLHAAYGWLGKLARNGERAFNEIGDPEILEMIDDAAGSVLVIAGKLRDRLQKFSDAAEGYNNGWDDASDPG